MTKKHQILMSATRMQTFLSCRWKYYCNYVLHLPRKPNVSFKLGLAVHESLALAGEIWKRHEMFTAEDIERVKSLYNKVAAREGISDTNIYNDGLSMVMHRLNNFVEGKILTIEDNFRVTTDDGVTIIGAMDKVEELNENTILVVDYKTSKYFETESELKSDIQLSMYDVVANIKYPDYKRIILSLDYLREDPVYTYRTKEERENFTKYMLAIYAEMLSIKKEDCTPVLNDMCNWCDFTDNCTAYQEALSGKSFFKKNPEEYTDDDLVKEYLDIKSRKRIIDKREQQLKSYIFNKIKSTGEDVIGFGKQLYIRQNRSVSYDPKSVFEAMPLEEFLKSIRISNKAVNDYLVKNPSAKIKIMDGIEKGYTSPFLAYKKLK